MKEKQVEEKQEERGEVVTFRTAEIETGKETKKEKAEEEKAAAEEEEEEAELDPAPRPLVEREAGQGGGATTAPRSRGKKRDAKAPSFSPNTHSACLYAHRLSNTDDSILMKNKTIFHEHFQKHMTFFM